jgi:hypothetical protein
MKKAGIALIALGFYCVLFAFNMDVVVGKTYNIGLMNERQNVIFLSGIIFLAGIILFGFGFSAKEESKNLKTFAITCFLSPVLLLVGIKIVASVQKSIKQESIRKQNAIDNEKYEKEMAVYKQTQAAELKRRQVEEAELKKKIDKEKQAKAKIQQEDLDRFVDNKDGTITDKTKGLVWQKCSVGQEWKENTCIGNAKEFVWDVAIKLTSNFTGKTNWRLPTNEELRSLVYCSDAEYMQNKDKVGSICINQNEVSQPTIINSMYFRNTNYSSYRYSFWSSSSFASGSTYKWYIDFDNGDAASSSTDDHYVRLVRK